jgi:hypothetical protein
VRPAPEYKVSCGGGDGGGTLFFFSFFASLLFPIYIKFPYFYTK